MTWKPREEYKTLVDRHNVILTRSKAFRANALRLGPTR
jgi:hypothetical protein